MRMVWPPRAEDVQIDDIEAISAENGLALSRPGVVRFFKDLGKLGYGRFIAGRRGYKSRFVWEFDVIRSRQRSPDGADEPSKRVAALDTLHHSFVLRRDFRVEFDLPANITQTEASRLAAFVTSLPLDGDHRE